jgi:tRNA threonylcarbamoyladenosine biosynthesis protein TsaB
VTHGPVPAPPMLLLAVDTSGAAVTAALHDGGRVLARRSEHEPRRHAELLAPSIEAVLREAGADRHALTAVAVGVGPGPFTGLRAGVVTGLVLGLALEVPVHGVCSLDALALQVAPHVPGDAPRFAVATDARRHELYWALYAPSGDGTPARLTGPVVTAPEALHDEAGAGVPVLGRGATLRPDLFAPPPGPLDADAGAVAEVAVRALACGGTGLLPPEPLYLRRPDAAPPGERKRVLR